MSSFNLINIPYGSCLLPSNSQHRQGAPGPEIFGNGIDYTNCMPRVVQPNEVLGPQNTKSVNILDSYFLRGDLNPTGFSEFSQTTTPQKEYSDTSIQMVRPPQPNKNYYIKLAGESLKAKPDITISVFFSDENINHIRNTIVAKVKEITADSGVAGSNEGVTIKTPNMDDLFYYMVNIYQNYKIHNGSICFVGKNNQTIKQEIAKLNSKILQEYISKMVSQINMYIHYYKDASQMPEQMSRPAYTAMKGSRVLEYNTGFYSGNSMGISSYNQVGNII